MITQETRERMENLIGCIRAKLEGKTIEWFDTVKEQWRAFAEDDWCFMSTSQLRIAPEPQEKHTAKLVIRPDGSKELYGGWWKGTLPSDSTIIELTETARIEPKKREPRRIWCNQYRDGGWSCGFNQKHIAESQKGSGILETAIEFVEVVK